MKKILITGGAGFIGSHLCKKLLSEGNKIFCLDNFYTGTKENIDELLSNSNFELIEQDVQNDFFIETDEIYNLACPASPVHYQKDKIYTAKTSVLGIINLLELASKNNAKILQASTSEVYGDPLFSPQTEFYWGNVNPIGIRSCYDEGKRIAETFMTDYHQQKNVDIKIIRIFNTYGPNMDEQDGRVVSNFIVQALKGEDVTVYGDGQQTRSFCYIDDLIDGMTKMMNSQNFTGPVNIGNDQETTISDFAKIIIKLTNSNSKIIHKPLPSDDPVQRRPDLNLAKSKLGWQPTVSLENGLLKTIDYFEKKLSQKGAMK